jgi:hypothetical protein
MATKPKTWLLLLGVMPVCFLLWNHQASPCQKTLSYRIGRFDPQFGIRQAVFLSIIKQAETIWETSVGKNLFTYDPAADFTLNLVYDERQQATMARAHLVHELQAIASSHTNLANAFEHWHAIFQEKNAAYQHTLERYQEHSKTYNDNVRYWNNRGGAPPELFRKLERERQQLEGDKDRLDKEREYLNRLYEKLKSMQAQGESIASTYQSQRQTYQAHFAETSRFNQGEYDGNSITVYQFNDPTDLTRLLTHELGHALGLAHVDDPKAVMYYLKGEQDRAQSALTATDVAALKNACNID